MPPENFSGFSKEGYCSWKAAFSPSVWIAAANKWFDKDSVRARAMCDSFVLKSQTALHFLPEMKSYGLSDSSIFFEYLDLGKSGIRQDRALALWIENPGVQANYPVCESSIRGAVEINGSDQALLLLDTKARRVLQRLDSIPNGWGGMGFSAPVLMRSDGVYHSSNRKKEENAWGIATVLFPRDVDGDGKSIEFLFYTYEACGVYDCAIQAYDPSADKLKIRPFLLQNTTQVYDSKNKIYVDSTYREKTNWVFDFPLEAVKSNGCIQYVKDVGHSSLYLYQYDLQYNRKKGLFEGSMKEKPYGE